MIENITEMLRDMTDIYRRIHEVSLQKRDAIVANDADLINDLVKQEWGLLGEASTLEESRIRAVSEALSITRKEAEAAGTLERIRELGTDAEKAELDQAAQELREAISALQTLNAELQDLVDLHLEYTNYMVNMVFKEPQVSSIYGTSGQVLDDDPETGNLHGIIDSQV